MCEFNCKFFGDGIFGMYSYVCVGFGRVVDELELILVVVFNSKGDKYIIGFGSFGCYYGVFGFGFCEFERI